MAIKIEMLRCFDAVVRNGSLADAAAQLGRTPSAVSMTLKQFEDHVGAALFETSRKSKLTALGALIHKTAAQELRHFDGTVATIEGLCLANEGFLRLAVTPSVASAFMPQIVGPFASRHPEVQIDLRDMDSLSIAAAMRNDEADIGIGSLPIIAGLERHRLFSDRFGVVCAASHPLARGGDTVTWAELANHTLIANGLCKLIEAQQMKDILAGSRMMVHNMVSLLGLMNAGVGVTVLPELAKTEEYADLVFRPLNDENAVRHVYMVTRPQAAMTPVAATFAADVLRAVPQMQADPAVL